MNSTAKAAPIQHQGSPQKANIDMQDHHASSTCCGGLKPYQTENSLMMCFEAWPQT